MRRIIINRKLPRKIQETRPAIWRLEAIRNEMNYRKLSENHNLPIWVFRNSKETEAAIIANHFKQDIVDVLHWGYEIIFFPDPSLEENWDKFLEISPTLHQQYVSLTLKKNPDSKKYGDFILPVLMEQYPRFTLENSIGKTTNLQLWREIAKFSKCEESAEELIDLKNRWESISRFEYEIEDMEFLQNSFFEQLQKVISKSLIALAQTIDKGNTSFENLNTIDSIEAHFKKNLKIQLPLCYITQSLLRKSSILFPLVDLEMTPLPNGYRINKNGYVNSKAVFRTDSHYEMIRMETDTAIRHALPMLIRCWLAMGHFEEGLGTFLTKKHPIA